MAKAKNTTIRGSGIRDSKRRGEWAEMRFMARAAEHGLQVNKPWGDSSSFDFVVGHGKQFWRVQVKSTKYEDGGGYPCNVRGGKSQRAYDKDAFDFLAVYVIPGDVWYILPAKEVLRKRAIALFPNFAKSKNAKYKEAWELLRAGVKARKKSQGEGEVGRMEACAEVLEKADSTTNASSAPLMNPSCGRRTAALPGIGPTGPRSHYTDGP